MQASIQCVNTEINLTFKYFQIIFRKVADVKKEKELAEKRKNDPPLELSNDHPVRKLISRFRKMGDNKGTDLEKGGPKVFGVGERPVSATKIINVSESPSSTNSVPKIGGGASKWGKILGGNVESKSNNINTYKLPETSAQEDATQKLTENKPRNNNEASRSIIRHVAKLNKVLENTPPPVDESPEDEEKSNLKKTESLDSGILKSNKTLDQISNSSDSSQCSRHQSSGPLSVAEQQMLTSLYDIRLEFKEEMEIMHQKMNRIDEQISEILRIFSPSVSQCSSHVPSCPCSHSCSKFTSPQNTTTNSAEHSPKTSLSSSPHRSSHGASSSSVHKSELANMCDDVINMDISQTAHEQERGNTKQTSNPFITDRHRIPKHHPKYHQTSSSENSENGGKVRAKINRVSPEIPIKNETEKSTEKTSPSELAGALTTRDIDIPIKDRDLDIL